MLLDISTRRATLVPVQLVLSEILCLSKIKLHQQNISHINSPYFVALRMRNGIGPRMAFIIAKCSRLSWVYARNATFRVSDEACITNDGTNLEECISCIEFIHNASNTPHVTRMGPSQLYDNQCSSHQISKVLLITSSVKQQTTAY